MGSSVPEVFMSKKVMQFRISLKETFSTVWRTIQIKETCTFWDLHVAIQDGMGWDGKTGICIILK